MTPRIIEVSCCADCLFCEQHDFEDLLPTCQAEGECAIEEAIDIETSRPDWCPLDRQHIVIRPASLTTTETLT